MDKQPPFFTPKLLHRFKFCEKLRMFLTLYKGKNPIPNSGQANYYSCYIHLFLFWDYPVLVLLNSLILASDKGSKQTAPK